MLNFRRANKSVHVIYIMNGTLVELMLIPVNHYVFIDQDVDYRYLEINYMRHLMTSLRWEMFVQRGSHENFLCTHLKVFGLQYIFDCINSHSDILSFSCIDLPLKKGYSCIFDGLFDLTFWTILFLV